MSNFCVDCRHRVSKWFSDDLCAYGSYRVNYVDGTHIVDERNSHTCKSRRTGPECALFESVLIDYASYY